MLRAMTGEAHRAVWPAFDALGLDRVVAGARALHAEDEGWEGCFLALAYGDRGELGRMLDEEEENTPDRVARLLGITVENVDAIAGSFDSDFDYFKSELTKWLNAHGANAATVLRETRREVRAQHLPPLQIDSNTLLSEEASELLRVWLAYMAKTKPMETHPVQPRIDESRTPMTPTKVAASSG